MFDEEEKRVEKWKQEIEKVETPHDALEEAIQQGFQRAKQVRKSKKHPYIKRSIWSVALAAVLFIALITSIRVSPAFAHAVASIPGFEKIVAFIQDDKGIEGAIHNKYYQELNLSFEKEGVTLTLLGAIADEQEIVIFYSVKGAKENEQFDLLMPDLLDLKGNDVAGGVGASSGPYQDFTKPEFEQITKVTFRLNDGVKDNDFIVKAKLNSNQRSIDYEIPLSLVKEKMPTIRYPVNETVSIEGQKMTIEQIEISPLKVGVHIRMDPFNTKEIFSFEDMRLVDEKGEIWTSIANGVTATYKEGNQDQRIYYLQSNYFEQPRQLTLQFNRLQALDKDEAYVIIDTDKGIILEQPADQGFSIMSSTRRYIYFTLQADEAYHSGTFSTIFDAEEKELHSTGGGFSHITEEQVEISVRISEESYVNPIKLPLTGYPQWIEGNVKIKIK